MPSSRVVTEESVRTSMLGLGDIGSRHFCSILLRFDAHQQQVKACDDDFYKLFHTTMFGYFLGLLTTVFVMYLFEAAQPALLYLVPAVLGSSFLAAFKRGEFADLLAYSEEFEEVTDEKDKKKEKKEK